MQIIYLKYSQECKKEEFYSNLWKSYLRFRFNKANEARMKMNISIKIKITLSSFRSSSQIKYRSVWHGKWMLPVEFDTKILSCFQLIRQIVVIFATPLIMLRKTHFNVNINNYISRYLSNQYHRRMHLNLHRLDFNFKLSEIMMKLTQWSLFSTNQMKYGLLTNYLLKFWEFKRPREYRGMTEIYSWRRSIFEWLVMITTQVMKVCRFTQQTNINMTIDNRQSTINNKQQTTNNK
jgi:hypothetical protein